ncbi:hypothetical protein J2X68_003812 [Streptomyces sp. 3330]|uniref:hypothetical protein n=1 Tax=Streptomyces sp. 3330 TaxID=2817755 RepID=UPI002862AABC|nr:hypothetical protein [Streptomyces sp. 3330]MDR6977118.1 hypothetical protein [Streptomyces sp. 3330]
MRSPTRARGRRGAVWGASAAAVVLAAGLSAACGGDGPTGGYVAIGGAGDTAFPDPRTGGSADPTDGVRLVPLDDASGPPAGRPGGPGSPAGETAGQDSQGATGDATAGGGGGGSRAGGAGSDAPQTATSGVPGSSGSSGSSGAEGGTAGSSAGSAGGTSPGSPSPAPTAPPSTPPEPASLAVSDPVRAGTDQRWCEDVTLVLRNSGGTAVRSGTVTFGTHVIDSLGIDWATRESTAALPTPIAAGARKEKTWTVCVDAWRVPLGMHIETRDVSVRWE